MPVSVSRGVTHEVDRDVIGREMDHRGRAGHASELRAAGQGHDHPDHERATLPGPASECGHDRVGRRSIRTPVACSGRRTDQGDDDEAEERDRSRSSHENLQSS
jgi:hypothetical protein